MAAHEKAPRGAGPFSEADVWLSELRWLDNETMSFLLGNLFGCLVSELRNMSGKELGREAIEFCLLAATDALNRDFSSIFQIRPAVTDGTPHNIGSFETFCDPVAYRLAAEAAKNRVRDFVKCDREQKESPSSSVVETR